MAVREPDEQALWTVRANREQSSLRQVGGRLSLTHRRLIFEPHGFDQGLGGRSWSAALADVSGVGVEPRSPAIPFLGMAARLRRRLRIEVNGGEVELFTVNGVDAVVARLQESIDAAV